MGGLLRFDQIGDSFEGGRPKLPRAASQHRLDVPQRLGVSGEPHGPDDGGADLGGFVGKHLGQAVDVGGARFRQGADRQQTDVAVVVAHGAFQQPDDSRAGERVAVVESGGEVCERIDRFLADIWLRVGEALGEKPH